MGVRPRLRSSRPRRPAADTRGRLPDPDRAGSQGRAMSTTAEATTAVRMSFHQFHFDMRAFMRNRQSQFFTLILPILFLVIFASVFGGSDTVKVAGGRIKTSVSYVPGIITLGIISAAFANLVISVTAQRESGVLKRRRATPVPASAIIGDRKSVV